MIPAADIQIITPNQMPPPPAKDKDWKQSTILGILTIIGVGGFGGGVPYITELQSKLERTREATIRLEEKIEWQGKKIESMERTLESIRSRLETKGIVNKSSWDTGQLSAEQFIQRK